MGRFVTYKEEIVWKYVFGEQVAELYRVPDETGVGEHSMIAYEYDKPLIDGTYQWRKVDPREEEFEGDILVLKKSDIPKLEAYLEQNSGEHFHTMLRAFINFMNAKEEEEFVLFGEF